MNHQSDSTTPRWRRWLARALAAPYADRPTARAFIDAALDDSARRRGWPGVLDTVRVCIVDAMITRWRPRGYRITAAPLANSIHRTSPTRSVLMSHLVQDLRFALRQLRRQPAFAAVAVITMALGVGANTAIFHVAWQTMLKPLPYSHSDQLVEVWEVARRNNSQNHSMPGKFRDVQRDARSLAVVAAYTGRSGTTDLTGTAEPVQLSMRAVTGNYFAVFGMSPLVGRTLTPADERAGGTAVISEALWSRQFGRRADIAGVRVRLDGRNSTIVGVMPEAFSVEGGRVDVWMPYSPPPDTPRLAAHYLRVVGRLAPGVTLEQANAEIATIADRASAMFPESDRQWTQRVVSLAEARRASSTGDAFTMLGLAALAVLLMACGNLMSLQLARGVARQREFGIRSALGASRRRVILQLMTEGMVVAIAGGALGVLVGAWSLRALAAVAPPDLSVAARQLPDWPVIALALGLACVSALSFSLVPAWRSAATAARWLQQRTESTDGRSARIRQALVAAQIGIAVLLLISATLLVSSFSRVLRVNPGFKADGALTFDASIPDRIDSYARRRALLDGIAGALMEVRGVTSVCAINEIPLDAQGGMTYVPEGDTRMIGAAPRNITQGCIDALGLTLTRGRAVTDHEQTRVGIVSESFTKTAWPNQNPIGKRVHLGVPDGALIEVVGVVADALQNSLEFRAAPQFYEAYTDGSAFEPNRFVVRATVPPAALFDEVRRAVRGVDADQTVARLRTLRDVIDRSTASRQFDLRLLGAFALVALTLAAIGVYGLLSQVLAQRTRELGVRLALGATPRSLSRLMMRYATAALAIGLPIGVGAAVLAANLLRQFMFRIEPTDPTVYLAATATLAAIVWAAAWLPARRAARIDPAATLR